MSPNKALKARRHPRVKVRGHVFIHNEAKLFIAPLDDISAGGVFVRNLTSLPSGSEVKIVVKGPGFSSPLQAVGVIVRVDQGTRKGVAVQFTVIDDATRDQIQSTVFETRMVAALKAA
jgi:c-di-GMP-binding flagellar brake protein YcgR